MSEPDESAARVPADVPVTGDDVVDDAVALLQGLDDVPVAERPEVFDAVHRTLQDRLADVEG